MNTKKLEHMIDWVDSIAAQAQLLGAQMREVLEEYKKEDGVYHTAARGYVRSVREDKET